MQLIGYHNTWCRRCSLSWPPPVIVENVFYHHSHRWGSLGHARSRQQLRSENDLEVHSVRPTDVYCPAQDKWGQSQTLEEGFQEGGETLQDRDHYQSVEHSWQSHTLHPQLLLHPPEILAEGKLGWNAIREIFPTLYFLQFSKGTVSLIDF